MGLSLLFGWEFLYLFLIYPMNVLRIAIREDVRGGKSWRAAFFSVLGKFPEMAGALKFCARRLTGKRHSIIEYK